MWSRQALGDRVSLAGSAPQYTVPGTGLVDLLAFDSNLLNSGTAEGNASTARDITFSSTVVHSGSYSAYLNGRSSYATIDLGSSPNPAIQASG